MALKKLGAVEEIYITPLVRGQVQGYVGVIAATTFLLDAGTGNTVLGCLFFTNPATTGVDDAASFAAKDMYSKLIGVGERLNVLTSDVIQSISLLSLSSATGTTSTTPATTLFGVSPSEAAGATLNNAIRNVTFDALSTGKNFSLSILPTRYLSDRYALLRLEVSSNG